VTNALLTPFDRDGLLSVRNRTVMSAMTRGFADADHCATPAIAEYYRKRAAGGCGLILTEGVVIHPTGDGYKDVPRIATDAQAESWRPVVDGVHAEGGKIALQLWHCGRISHEDYTDGNQPVSSTAQVAAGTNRQNNKPYGTPRPLPVEEMPVVYKYFTDAATRSFDVGFDAVELHLGHGYLADQFLDARVNDRTDAYGGSVENRCRFTLELVREIMKVAPADKVIGRISPSRFMGELYDWPDLEAMLDYIIPELWAAGLRILDISCANADYYATSGRIIRMVRPNWAGMIIGGASLTAEQAEKEVADGLLDLVTWGRSYIANPDLTAKIAAGEAFVPFDNAMRDTLV
jgi:N-ethylmaleimide reductase